jgi:CubicO group peptidase (beta-lactamase class C family)
MSMTKPVVSVAVLMLVEEGKLRLTDPAGKFIPELQNLKVAVPNSEGLIARSVRENRCPR